MEPKKPEDDKYMADVRDGMFNGINGDWEKIKALLADTGNKMHTNYVQGMGDLGNLRGLQNVMTGQAQPQVPHMADGGTVADPSDQAAYMLSMGTPMMGPDVQPQSTAPANPWMQGAAEKAAEPTTMQPWMMAQAQPQAPAPDQDFINKLNQGMDMTPPANPISSAMSKVQSTAPTPPAIYQGMTAEDRAALMQKLIAQKNSGGMLVAKGAAGLGDAITSAFGKTPTNAMGNLREAADKNVEQRIGVMDTERKQKLEDLQANQEASLNDPNSTLSQSMRQTLKSAGMNVPSGMSGAIMLKIAGPLGELAMKQAMLAETTTHHQGELASAAAERARKTDEYASEHPFLNWLNPVDGGAPKSPVSNPNVPGNHPATWSSDKEARYQQWKATHGA